MRKISLFFMYALAICLIGCSEAKTSEVKGEKGVGPENTYTFVLADDASVVPMKTATESTIDLSGYDNILDKATEIVYGEIESIANFNGEGGTAWVKEQVRVIESYKGEFSEDDVIQVIQQTGYISGDDYILSFKENEREDIRKMIFAGFTDEEIEALVLDQTSGIPLDEVGDKIVFCLWESSQSTDEATYYEPVGDWAGKQVQIGEDEFAQFYPIISGQETYSANDNYKSRSEEEMRTLLKIE